MRWLLASLVCLVACEAPAGARDPRAALAFDVVIQEWEAEYGPLHDETCVRGVPIGLVSDICRECGRQAVFGVCGVGGCFSPSRQAILLDASATPEWIYGDGLTHELLHAIQWCELALVDIRHEHPSWETVLHRAQEAIR